MKLARVCCAVALLATVGAAAADAACSDDRVDLRGAWGTTAFHVEVADEPRERSRGLMHRTELSRDAGMLFVFDRPQRVSFWMRNTLIPLDMIFLGPDGVVRHIHENAVPLDETPIPGGQGILAVLEINGGQAAELGLTVGSQMRHPAFDLARAAWACP